MHPATYGSSVQTAIPVGDTMPAYAATGSAPACPQSSVVEEQSWEAPLRYESAASSASACRNRTSSGMQEDQMVAPKLATSRLPRSGDAPERGGRPCISEEAG